MQKFYEALFDQLQARHREIIRILDELPTEAYDWKPAPELNSMAVLIFHMTGGERYWVGDVVKGEDSHRDRDAEFKVSGLSREALKKRIEDVEAAIKAVKTDLIATLPKMPRNGKLDTSRLSIDVLALSSEDEPLAVEAA